MNAPDKRFQRLSPRARNRKKENDHSSPKPQSQTAAAQNQKPSEIYWVGIDIAKHELQIHFKDSFPATRAFPKNIPNDPASLKKLVAHLKKNPRFHVIFEATGGYEKPLLKALQANAIPCSRVNPRHVRDFARAQGKLAKTDKLDAALLADFGATLGARTTPVTAPGLEELRALIDYRRHLQETLVREKAQLEHPKPTLITQAVKARIRSLQAQITRFDQHLAAHLKAHPILQQAAATLSATKGVGPLTAASLLAAMPELGTLNRNQAAALAGLAPMNCDSGTMRGKRSTQGGRKDIRQALYMAALVASRHNEILKTAYQQLIARGKPKKLALVAIMRRLLIHLNSLMANLLKSQTPANSTSS